MRAALAAFLAAGCAAAPAAAPALSCELARSTGDVFRAGWAPVSDGALFWEACGGGPPLAHAREMAVAP